MRAFAFELTLLCLLTSMVFPVALLGAISTGIARHERLALLASAGLALCVAGVWFAIMLY
ncbi:MAG: hypothetical protein HYY28_09485 [Betaproteobacteria bacterium]|nr:hypothetical protein [Betaproteobacteria bacterium]MBI2960533.1 hypothetical protein [Betaproteobacteria bacterium]